MSMNFFESPLVSEDDLGKYARLAFQDAMASGVNVDMLMRHFRAVVDEAQVQAQHRIRQASHPSVDCADAICEDTIKREQGLFEQVVQGDGDFNKFEKTPDGRSYVHERTNSIWMGWICKALHSIEAPNASGSVAKERKDQQGEGLYQVAINCPHAIDSEKVVLYRDPGQPGKNALNQLSMRLTSFFRKS